MSPERKDYYYHKAKKEHLRSRAAFKLQEIQDKFGLLRRGDLVLEIGSSPGGWSEVAREITQSAILAFDQSEMVELEGVEFHKKNINSPTVETLIEDFLNRYNRKGFNCILSDAMIKTSGDSSRDHAGSYMLCERVMKLSQLFLLKGGNTLVKQFQGDLTKQFVDNWKRSYRERKVTKPTSSRKGSSELYILFLGFTGKLPDTDRVK